MPDIIGRDGKKRTFTFWVSELIQRDTSGGEFESYEFKAKDLNNTKGECIVVVVTNFSGIYQITNIMSTGKTLREKGIPEVLIGYACQYLNKGIESSSNIKSEMRYFGEKRYSDGEKVWLRLKKLEPTRISFDNTVDRFTLSY